MKTSESIAWDSLLRRLPCGSASTSSRRGVARSIKVPLRAQAIRPLLTALQVALGQTRRAQEDDSRDIASLSAHGPLTPSPSGRANRCAFGLGPRGRSPPVPWSQLRVRRRSDLEDERRTRRCEWPLPAPPIPAWDRRKGNVRARPPEPLVALRSFRSCSRHSGGPRPCAASTVGYRAACPELSRACYRPGTTADDPLVPRTEPDVTVERDVCGDLALLRRPVGQDRSETESALDGSCGNQSSMLSGVGSVARRPSEPSQSGQIHPHLKRHGVFRHHVAAKCADVHVGVE